MVSTFFSNSKSEVFKVLKATGLGLPNCCMNVADCRSAYNFSRLEVRKYHFFEVRTFFCLQVAVAPAATAIPTARTTSFAPTCTCPCWRTSALTFAKNYVWSTASAVETAQSVRGGSDAKKDRVKTPGIP